MAGLIPSETEEGRSLRRVSMAAPSQDRVSTFPDGLRPGVAGYQTLGKLLGSTRTGIGVYDLAPGEALSPYHYEYPEEEWLVVLDGRPLLRHPGGEDQLEPWDIVLFPPGPEGAHQVRNATSGAVRVLMFANMSTVGASVYPDSDKIGVWTGNDDDDIIVRRSSAVDYSDGEPDVP
jgi:uncharacterized cupin superfamily protein